MTSGEQPFSVFVVLLSNINTASHPANQVWGIQNISARCYCLPSASVQVESGSCYALL